MDGRKVATVWLDPERRGRVSGRLGPLPAFRAVARLHEALKAAQAAVEERSSARCCSPQSPARSRVWSTSSPDGRYAA